jgi:hypothetical protein
MHPLDHARGQTACSPQCRTGSSRSPPHHLGASYCWAPPRSRRREMCFTVYCLRIYLLPRCLAIVKPEIPQVHPSLSLPLLTLRPPHSRRPFYLQQVGAPHVARPIGSGLPQRSVPRMHDTHPIEEFREFPTPLPTHSSILEPVVNHDRPNTYGAHLPPHNSQADNPYLSPNEQHHRIAVYGVKRDVSGAPSSSGTRGAA